MNNLQKDGSTLSSHARQNFESGIASARTSSQLAYTVTAYLTNIGATREPQETYAQLAARLGGDELLAAAGRRERELETQADMPWAAISSTSH